LFSTVTPDGFEDDEGGDGEIEIICDSQMVIVHHNQNVVRQESDTYEV
jgi:hypothetical protein